MAPARAGDLSRANLGGAGGAGGPTGLLSEVAGDGN